MIHEMFKAFWLFLPAGIANMAPPIANKIPGLNKWKTPLDFGKSYHGKRIFGDNKTWRGIVTGVVAAGIVSVLEHVLIHAYALTLQVIILSALLGLMLGFGALAGDAIESFFKRRAHVKPGHSWFPFDQIDYIVGGLIFSLFIFYLPIVLILWIFAIYFGLHLVISYIGYLLGFKDQPI